ncbi:MAG: 5,10-methylenetetrahydrofolate reductase [Desulfobacterales bacterium]|jgi:methylenetetrahydrofolate reductase (NADPH)|nr:5,10-methylenetetrahydrofolate reductase [Desulfobacteraceae bacterium]MBT4362878.1 5,10-methylenetetrahydrofolate reductase [Desulfobacteraceae bacterium]MBT7696885.1 5,10-methylenetetrahydrofolate reductase [Desulfobacterales bacterium]
MSLKSKLDSNEFAILAEIEPPKGVDVSEMTTNAAKVKGVVDAFVVPEMSNAVMRMSSLGASMILQSKGLDTIMQVCCRDRNRLALQADILAAGACGIENIMAVTGEDPSFGDHHQAKAVYGVELIELLDAIQMLQSGRDMAGIDLQGTPVFEVGSTVNAGLKGDELEIELEEMNKKIESGTRFFITPPLFDIESIEPFLKVVDHTKTKIIPTVLLLKSVGMARYMGRNMKHVHIPDYIIKRITKAPDKVRECILITRDLIGALEKEGLSGAFISTIGWEQKLPEILGLTGN